MSAPQFSVEGVRDALAMQERRGAGRVVMFVAARRCEAVTLAARAMALAAGETYAVDLDLKRNGLARALSADGAFGEKLSGAIGGCTFFKLRDGGDTQSAFAFYRVGDTRAHAGMFDARQAPHGATISPAGDYWNAARAIEAVFVVEAPALDRSTIALRTARHMDGVVLVVDAAPGAAPAAMAAKAALVEAGANVLGLIYAGAAAPILAIDKALGQAR